MRTLAIDSATEACSVAVFDDGVLIAGEYRILGRGHAELLVPMIAALPDKGRADRVLVALGPGSFTGVRVGLAAAKALAFAWGSELQGYSTLALVAAMAHEHWSAVPLTVAMTGGHGEWFLQRFDGRLMPIGALQSLSPQVAATELPDHFCAGNQAEALIQLRGSGEAYATLPDARSTVLLPEGAFTRDITPIYGRAPDARLPGSPQ
jgi:tRNA threonylcarbamoyladenosine biosynthesis protein TsaB